MIDPTRKTISEIFKTPTKLMVPNYQRDFKWGTDEAREMMMDIKSLMNSRDNQCLFFGNIIVSKNTTTKKGALQIVDGQQRLTTWSILLIACRKLAAALEKDSKWQASVIQDKITFKNETSGFSEGPILIVSNAIRTVYEHICSNQWDEIFPTEIDGRGVKREVNKIKPIFEYFFSEIESFTKKELEHFLKTFYDSYVIYLEVDKPEEAFDIFERTNARGIDLDAADLLKNFLFQQKHLRSINIELDEYWTEIVENANGTIMRMLKYYWVARSGYVKKKILYPNLRDRGIDIGAKKLVEEILDFSRYYSAFRSGDEQEIKSFLKAKGYLSILKSSEYVSEFIDTVQALNLFKVTQAIPLIYSILNSYHISGGAEKTSHTKILLRLLKNIEKYHFVNNVVCERVGNEVEMLYADYSKLFFSSKNFEKRAQELTSELNKKLAKSDEFVPRFSEISYSASNIPLLSYIFDRINNFGLKKGQQIKIFYPDRTVIRRNFDIEHFYPQKGKKEDKLPDIGDSLHIIGNILIVSSFVNMGMLSNLSPLNKAKALNEKFDQIQNSAHIRIFLDKYKPDKYEWNEEKILERSNDLAVQAYNDIWTIKMS